MPDDTEETATPQPSVEMVPVRGGDLFIAIPEDISSFDPLKTSNEDLSNFYTLMYQSPFAYDENGRLVNELVESWDVSADGRVFTFKIREDVFFSDGKPLTGEDVYESARRAMSAASSSADSGEGGDEEPDPNASPTPRPTADPSESSIARQFAEHAEGIESLDLTGDYTMELRMRDPGNEALRFMTFPVTQADFSENDVPVGTGAYAVTSLEEDGRMTLEPNPYWTGSQPYIERIVANPVTSPSEQIGMQQTSMLDFVTTDALNAGNYNIAGKSRVVDYMTDYFDCLMPNLSDPELASMDVRKAISDALDRRALLSTVLINHGVPTVLPISPDSFVADTRFRSSQRDIESALQRLQAAGYRYEPDGEGRVLSFELIVASSLDNSYRLEAARAIKKQLADVFIEVDVVSLDAEEYVRRLENGSYDMAYCSFYLSEFPELGFLFNHDGYANYSGFYDQQVEDAIIQCEEALTEEEMITAYASLQELLNAYLPIIGLYFRMHSVICDEGIGGMQGVRAGTIFSNIESWYVTSAPESLVPNSTPRPSPTPGSVTVPESLATPTPTVPGVRQTYGASPSGMPQGTPGTMQVEGAAGALPGVTFDASPPTYEPEPSSTYDRWTSSPEASWEEQPTDVPEPTRGAEDSHDPGDDSGSGSGSEDNVGGGVIIIPPDGIISPPND